MSLLVAVVMRRCCTGRFCTERAAARKAGAKIMRFISDDFLRLSEKGIKKECFLGLVDQFGII